MGARKTEILKRIQTLLDNTGGEIKLHKSIPVADPEAEPERKPGYTIRIDMLLMEDGKPAASGDVYEDGAWAEGIDPILLETLKTHELEKLRATAQQTHQTA